MLLRTDPIRDFDRLAQQFFGTAGTASRPVTMPLDSWRDGDDFFIELDLPGVDPATVDLDVERNVLTVRAERPAPADTHEWLVTERPHGVFSRQVILGDTLDADRAEATYDGGVLQVRIPVAEKAKPRKITVQATANEPRAIGG
ncbi:MAG: Hsp20/alpha crystallin family protein [Actinomycetota bacterium]|nr:MAG: Hsp20/alpha crystallin family protein [Actinomycetota bacterium]